MSGIGARPITRIKGRPALVRRLRALLVACHRFGRCRAVTADDQRWAALVLDGLTATLATADPEGAPRPDPDQRRPSA